MAATPVRDDAPIAAHADVATRALQWLVRTYQLLLSPWSGGACRFSPSCSAYAIESLKRYGAWRGGARPALSASPGVTRGVRPVSIPSVEASVIDSMERRVLLAVVLSFVVLFGYQALFVKPNVKPPVPAATTSTAPAATAPVEAPSAPPAPSGPMPAVLAGESSERRIVIETSRVKATFSNHGAVLESWLLKDYLDSNGRPMDMVAPALTVPERHPLSLTVGDAALSARLNNALDQASSGDQKVEHAPGMGRSRIATCGRSVPKTIDVEPDGQPFCRGSRLEVLVDGYSRSA